MSLKGRRALRERHASQPPAPKPERKIPERIDPLVEARKGAQERPKEQTTDYADRPTPPRREGPSDSIQAPEPAPQTQQTPVQPVPAPVMQTLEPTPSAQQPQAQSAETGTQVMSPAPSPPDLSAIPSPTVLSDGSIHLDLKDPGPKSTRQIGDLVITLEQREDKGIFTFYAADDSAHRYAKRIEIATGDSGEELTELNLWTMIVFVNAGYRDSEAGTFVDVKLPEVQAPTLDIEDAADPTHKIIFSICQLLPYSINGVEQEPVRLRQGEYYLYASKHENSIVKMGCSDCCHLRFYDGLINLIYAKLYTDSLGKCTIVPLSPVYINGLHARATTINDDDTIRIVNNEIKIKISAIKQRSRRDTDIPIHVDDAEETPVRAAPGESDDPSDMSSDRLNVSGRWIVEEEEVTPTPPARVEGLKDNAPAQPAPQQANTGRAAIPQAIPPRTQPSPTPAHTRGSVTPTMAQAPRAAPPIGPPVRQQPQAQTTQGAQAGLQTVIVPRWSQSKKPLDLRHVALGMAVAIVLAFGTAVGLLISRGSNTTTPPVATQRLDAGTASRGRGPETTPIPEDTPQTKKDTKKEGESRTAPSKNKGTGRDRTGSGSRTKHSGTGRTKTQVTFTDKEATVQPTAAEIKEEPAPPQATRVQMTLNDFATSYAT